MRKKLGSLRAFFERPPSPERRRKAESKRARKILERVTEELGPTCARVIHMLINQYPLRELADSPGMYFIPDHKIIYEGLGISETIYRAALGKLIEEGYLAKRVIEKQLMYEIQFEKLI